MPSRLQLESNATKGTITRSRISAAIRSSVLVTGSGIPNLLLFKLSGGYEIQVTQMGITGLTNIGEVAQIPRS